MPVLGPGLIRTGEQHVSDVNAHINHKRLVLITVYVLIMIDNYQLNIYKIEQFSEISSVCTLAKKIWREHYVSIIGAAQVEYMLANMQSVDAIQRQLQAGYDYYLVCRSNRPVAYFAYLGDDSSKSLLISKLYVARSERQSGIGKLMLSTIGDDCRRLGLKEIWLTVNKKNAVAIEFYQKKGFNITGTLLQDIGGGFFMDDYRMSKSCRHP